MDCRFGQLITRLLVVFLYLTAEIGLAVLFYCILPPGWNVFISLLVLIFFVLMGEEMINILEPAAVSFCKRKENKDG